MYILWAYTQNDKKKKRNKMTVYDLLRLDENYAKKREAKIAQKKEAAAAAA